MARPKRHTPEQITQILKRNVACAFMKAGESEKALDYLEEQVRMRGVDTAWVEHDSDWRLVREHPRFKALFSSVEK